MENQTEVNEEAKKVEGEVVEETTEAEASEKNEDNVEELKTEESSEEKALKEAAEWKDKYFRLAAEFDNSIKRFEREKDDLRKYGAEKLLKNIVSAMDNFDRTLDAIKDDEDEKMKNVVSGIKMVQKMFIDTLEKEGLKRINSLGEIFDPNFHEAMSQVPAEGKKENEIIQVFEEGYELNGRLIRAAKVILAK
jgi:molecular chaperone GrpE